jgi:predicted RNase H-like HicB family nuclease
MRPKGILTKYRGLTLPIFIEKDEDDFYVVECPVLRGCYTQGETVDEALANIREVIELILEEKKNQEILKSYRPRELSLHTITL